MAVEGRLPAGAVGAVKALAIVIMALALAAGLGSVAAYLRQDFLQSALLAGVTLVLAFGSGFINGSRR